MCCCVSYEEMVTDFAGWLKKVVERFELQDGDATYRMVLAKRAEEVAPVAEENIWLHKRKVTPGDYLEKLRPETFAELDRRFASVSEALGYPQGRQSRPNPSAGHDLATGSRELQRAAIAHALDQALHFLARWCNKRNRRERVHRASGRGAPPRWWRRSRRWKRRRRAPPVGATTSMRRDAGDGEGDRGRARGLGRRAVKLGRRRCADKPAHICARSALPRSCKFGESSR